MTLREGSRFGFMNSSGKRMILVSEFVYSLFLNFKILMFLAEVDVISFTNSSNSIG